MCKFVSQHNGRQFNKLCQYFFCRIRFKILQAEQVGLSQLRRLKVARSTFDFSGWSWSSESRLVASLHVHVLWKWNQNYSTKQLQFYNYLLTVHYQTIVKLSLAWLHSRCHLPGLTSLIEPRQVWLKDQLFRLISLGFPYIFGKIVYI